MKAFLFGVVSLILGFFSVLPALADDETPQLAPGQTLVTLSASDQKDIQQDLLVASLRIDIEDKDSKVVQDKVNKAMKQAVDAAKTMPDVKVSTGQYYVYQYEPDPEPRPLTNAQRQKKMLWKASQTLDIQSKKAENILELSGKIQEMGFVMNGLNYTLSSELAESQKDELLVGALKKIQDKANLISKSLGKSGYDIIEVNVEGAYMPTPTPMMMKAPRAEMAMVSEDVAEPVAVAGESQVSLSVSARVLLKP